jgi:hypothetical protein
LTFYLLIVTFREIGKRIFLMKNLTAKPHCNMIKKRLASG